MEKAKQPALNETPSTEKITILIVDDHTLIREIWALILNNHPAFQVVAECSSSEDAVEKARLLRPNIVMMDINLPGMNGMEATTEIRKYSPGSKIIGLSMHNQPTYARKIMQKGAMGYVTKNSTKDELFKAILEVHAGRKYICNEVKNILSDQLMHGEEVHTGINALSQREIEIISQIKKGASSKDIAKELCISPKTVEVHRYNIFKKLNLKNATSLVNFINNSSLQFAD
jgi:two-component system invasion response regulator UvrY